MQTTPKPLRPVQNEVHRTAHDQDLIEVPKRARLDRKAEGEEFLQLAPNSSTGIENRSTGIEEQG